MYKNILILTNAHKQSYNGEKQINSNKGFKYGTIISKLFPPKSITKKSQLGKGLMVVDQPMIHYYNDSSEIVDRLQLFFASQQGGNTSNGNEIESILEELKEDGYIRL